jgi:hypothetical protein
MMQTKTAVALTASVWFLGGSLVQGFADVAQASSDHDYGIMQDSDGQLRDCTVTDIRGARADFNAVCDAYWR